MLFSRSTDGGKSFAEPQPITASNESQRFEALALDADGSVFAAWLDKRNRVPAQQSGRKYDGAALFFASSRDGGATYSEAHMASDNTCECCRLGIAFAGPGRPVVVFRNIFDDGIRDHAIVTFVDPATPGEVQRVSQDDWQIAACPHHGPSLSISAAGTYHVTWYTNGSFARACSTRARGMAGKRSPIRFRLGSPTEARHARTSSPGRTAPSWSGKSSMARKPRSI